QHRSTATARATPARVRRLFVRVETGGRSIPHRFLLPVSSPIAPSPPGRIFPTNRASVLVLRHIDRENSRSVHYGSDSSHRVRRSEICDQKNPAHRTGQIGRASCRER